MLTKFLWWVRYFCLEKPVETELEAAEISGRQPHNFRDFNTE